MYFQQISKISQDFKIIKKQIQNKFKIFIKFKNFNI